MDYASRQATITISQVEKQILLARILHKMMDRREITQMNELNSLALLRMSPALLYFPFLTSSWIVLAGAATPLLYPTPFFLESFPLFPNAY